MPKSPQKELQEFLASFPWWMQRALSLDYSWRDDPSVARSDKLAWIQGQNWERELRPKFEEILKRDRVKWNEYCRRAKQNDRLTARMFRTAPKGLPGAPRKREAERYLALHSHESYREIAKHELKEELQSTPDEETKKLLVEKERERIRQSVSRSRRR